MTCVCLVCFKSLTYIYVLVSLPTAYLPVIVFLSVINNTWPLPSAEMPLLSAMVDGSIRRALFPPDLSDFHITTQHQCQVYNSPEPILVIYRMSISGTVKFIFPKEVPNCCSSINYQYDRSKSCFLRFFFTVNLGGESTNWKVIKC